MRPVLTQVNEAKVIYHPPKYWERCDTNRDHRPPYIARVGMGLQRAIRDGKYKLTRYFYQGDYSEAYLYDLSVGKAAQRE